MKNLWVFITKYNAFFLFILFFGFSAYLIVKNNSFQRASAINSSNQIIGASYSKINAWKGYLHLNEANSQLAEENTLLRKQLQSLIASDTTAVVAANDSINDVRYNYIVARVTNNSIHQKNNYITIDKGSKHGLRKGMGVISPNGIVGIILNVSLHFATIQSLLHSDTRISAELGHSHAFGSLVWGENYDAQTAMLKDIPNHVTVDTGESVYTSGYSLFPPGIQIGKVNETGISSGDSFLDIRIQLSTNFHNLQYVYVVVDLFGEEKQLLEATTEDND